MKERVHTRTNVHGQNCVCERSFVHTLQIVCPFVGYQWTFLYSAFILQTGVIVFVMYPIMKFTLLHCYTL